MALHLRTPQRRPVVRGDVLIRPLPHGVRQAGLADLAVLQSLFRDDVPSVLCHTQVLRLYQIVQTLGVIEVVDAVVAHGQILHGRRHQRLRDTGSDV